MVDLVEFTTTSGRKLRDRLVDGPSAFQGLPSVHRITEVQLEDGSWKRIFLGIYPTTERGQGGALPNGDIPIGYDMSEVKQAGCQFIQSNVRLLNKSAALSLKLNDAGHLIGIHVDPVEYGWKPFTWYEAAVGGGSWLVGGQNAVRLAVLPNQQGQVNDWSWYHADRGTWLSPDHPIANPDFSSGGRWHPQTYIKLAPKLDPLEAVPGSTWPNTNADPRIPVEAPEANQYYYDISPYALANGSSWIWNNVTINVAQKTNGQLHGPAQHRRVSFRFGEVIDSDPDNLHLTDERIHYTKGAYHRIWGKNYGTMYVFGKGFYGGGASDPGWRAFAYPIVVAEEALVIKSPNGAKWKINVSDLGVLSVTLFAVP